MIKRDELISLDNSFSELSNSFSELTIARVHHEAAQRVFEEKHDEIKKSLRGGQTTGNEILDWALLGEYPYQERLKKAQLVNDYLREHVGDYFFFLDFDHYTKLHLGKIASRPLYLAEGELKMHVDDSTLVHKKVKFYSTQLPLIYHENRHSSANSLPFIEGLIMEPYRFEEGVFESTHGLFTSDEHHYVLGAGQENVLPYLHSKKILVEPTEECLDELLSK